MLFAGAFLGTIDAPGELSEGLLQESFGNTNHASR